MDLLLGSLEQGLIFGIMAIGVYLTYRILDFPDLSVDGTFPLGASVTALFLTHEFSPFIAILASILCGAVAGGVTGILHVKLKITNLLAGILMMISLYSINLRIMGKANVPLFNTTTVFNLNISTLAIIACIALVSKLMF
ncbi:MAG TPA: ABC transporter permease, partial [Firmicutes bacterium]|nr:ABC transporter permease [Bacillota bacterium]